MGEPQSAKAGRKSVSKAGGKTQEKQEAKARQAANGGEHVGVLSGRNSVRNV